MRLLTLNSYRALGIPGVSYLKPESLFANLHLVREADWVLFPESWQVNALTYALKKRIFPNAASFHLGYDKVEMTRAFWSVCPANVPHTLILPSSDAAIAEATDQLDFPLVAKEPRNSMGNGVFLLEDHRQLREFAARVPVLYLQEYLPIRRDLRIVWVGRQVIGAYWRIGAEGAFHNNVARGGCVDFDGVPAAAVELVTRVAQVLGVDHAGFDVAEVGGHYYLFEFNTLFGNDALTRRGISLAHHIHQYLLSLPQTPPLQPGHPPLLRAG